MKKKLLVIVCTAAGKQAEVVELLKEVLDAHENITYKIITIKIPPDMKGALKGVRLNTYDAVAVYGGDGTIVAAYKIFQDYKLPVLTLPGGTANVLANYFGMPNDTAECLELYLNNTFVVNRLDIANVNDEPLVLDMHMGLWTEALTDTPREHKRRYGPAAYGWSALKKVSKTPAENYEFSINGQASKTIKAYTFLVVNQGKHEILGLPLFSRDHSPGEVQIAIVKSVKPRHLIIWFLYKLFTNGRNLQSVVETHRAKKLLITKAPKKMIADDTERSLRPPVLISGSLKGVRVIMPAATMETRPLVQLRRRFQLWLLRVWHRIRVFADLGPSLRYSHVAPGIYLGGKVTRGVFKTFRDWGITGVVSMRTSKPPKTPADIETLWLPTRDWTPSTLANFKKGVEFIQKHIDKNGAVYIHCQLGEGRGPSMAAAYLVTKGFTVEEAIALLVKYRPMVHPNKEQLKRLAEWQEEHNKLSV